MHFAFLFVKYCVASARDFQLF